MKISINTLLRICSYISLAIYFMPVVDYYCPWYITMFPALLVICLSLYVNQGIYAILSALLSISGLAILVLWFIKREDPLGTYFVNFYITFLPVIISIQLNKVVKDETFFRDYLRAATFFAAATCITTMIGHNVYPMASRELASGTEIYDTTKYLKVNIGGYEFIYALVLMIPIALSQRKKEKGLWRNLYVVAAILMVMCIYSSQYTIALIAIVVAFMTIWILSNPKAGAVACGILVAFFLINGLDLLAKLFFWASQTVGSEYMADRLLQVAQLLAGQRVDTDTSSARIEHYEQQLELFARNPVFGNNLGTFDEKHVSGHSFILDLLGAGGILGTGLALLLLLKLYRLAVPVFDNKTSKAVRAVWIMAGVIAVLNPITFPIIITVAFPCCMCVQRLEKGEI